MKNTIKLSLVAAVAVAGLTTNAAAGSLENAIKDTTISGKAMVGYNYADTNIASALGGVTDTANGANDSTSNQTEYDFDITMNTKVNDTITFTSGIQADHTVDNRDETTNTNGSQAITLTKLYFTAKTDVATVMVGKQKQPTVFLDDERGDGVVALVPAGPVTIAAGHISGLLADREITAAAVIGTVGPVNASLWGVNVTNGTDAGTTASAGADGIDGNADDVAAVAPAALNDFSGYSLNLNGTFGPVKVDLTHSSMDSDIVGSDSETLTKLIVSGKVADVNLVAGYGFTNDDNDNTRDHGVDLTTDGDAKTNFRLDQIVLNDFNDADALLLGASMTFGKTTVGASYLMATVDQNGAADIDGTELDLTVAYAMSKNFSITGLYSDAELENGAKIYDETRMELSLNYKF